MIGSLFPRYLVECIANVRWYLFVGLLASTTGCHRGALYKSSNLPPEFAAAPLQSARSLDLTRLAESSTSLELIQPGDVLGVTVAAGVEERAPTEWLLRVSRDGQVDVPLVGPVAVVGERLTEAQRIIRDESIRRDIYRQPHVSVTFKTRQSNRVTVVGAVKQPGVKELPTAASHLVDALVAAGGLGDYASTLMEVRYPPPNTLNESKGQFAGGISVSDAAAPSGGTLESHQIDLANLEVDNAGPYPLPDGTVLMVKERPVPMVSVMGLVKRAGQYEIPRDTDLRLLDAIALAGGRTMEIADKVTIVRPIAGRTDPIVISASVGEAKRNAAANIRMAVGDIVSVDETPMTFTVETIRNRVGIGMTSPIPGL